MHSASLFAMIVYLVSVRFGFHLCYSSNIFVFVLSLICIFNLRSIYSFILIQQKNKNKSNTKPEEWNNKNNARIDKKTRKNFYERFY